MTGTQEFHDGVGQAIQAETFNQINIGKGEPLGKTQRNDLNTRVQELAHELDYPPWQIWQTLHRTIGVEGIAKMRTVDLLPARNVLDLLTDHATSKQRWAMEKQELLDTNGKLLRSLEIARRNLEQAHAPRKPLRLTLFALVLGGGLGAAGAAVFFMAPW